MSLRERLLLTVGAAVLTVVAVGREAWELRGRLHFHHITGERAAFNSGAPSALIAYGAEDAAVLASDVWPGQYVQLPR